MKAPYGFKQKYSDILLVLSNRDGPISKEEFYHHDFPINPSPQDHVVELKLVTKKVIE